MPPLWTLAYLWGHPCTGRRSRALSQFRGLSSWASSPPPCNWLWQPHTWQRWGRWRGSSVHRCADLQQREAQGEGRESPRATDSWSRSVSQQICHQCPCHLESTWWLGSCTGHHLQICGQPWATFTCFFSKCTLCEIIGISPFLPSWHQLSGSFKLISQISNYSLHVGTYVCVRLFLIQRSHKHGS